MFQKAAVFLSWQAELLPGFSLKQAIVRVPMNHPEHTQKHEGVVSCELRGARKKPEEFQGLAVQVVRSEMAAYRGLVCAEGCTSEQTSYMGHAVRISAVILTTAQHATAFPSAPSGGTREDGWQKSHSCLMPPPVCLCTPTASTVLSLGEVSL